MRRVTVFAPLILWILGTTALLPISCRGDSPPETNDRTRNSVAPPPEVTPFREVSGPFGTMNALAFSGDGRNLLAGPGVFMPGVQIFAIREWNVESMTEVAKLEGHERGVAFLALASDSRHLASAGHDNTVRIWDLVEHREVACLRVPTIYDTTCITCLKFSSTGSTLILGGGENDEMSISIWDWKQDRIVKRIPCGGWSQCLSVTGGGNHVIVGGWHGSAASPQPFLALLDLSTGDVIRNFKSKASALSAVALAPDGQIMLASGTGGLLDCYDLRIGQPLRSLVGHKKVVAGISFLGSENDAITAGNDGRIIRWDVKNGTARWSLETGHRIRSMAVSPAGDLVAVGARDGWIAIWKISDLDEKLAKPVPSSSAPE